MSRTTYEEMCASHRWNVPERYNIAADVCDKHPRDKPAMIWESFDGATRELDWGELQDLANQAAHTLAARGVERGDRVAVVLPPTPETAAVFFGVWKLGAILLSMSVLYGDDAIAHRLGDAEAKLVVTDATNAPRFANAPQVLLLDGDTLAGAPTDFVGVDTAADDPAQLYYTSGTTGLAKGIAHAHRYILAHGSSSTATRSRTASVSTGWASGRGPRGSRRCSARGGSARCSACTGARAASTRTSSSTSCRATGSRTSSRPRRRCAR